MKIQPVTESPQYNYSCHFQGSNSNPAPYQSQRWILFTLLASLLRPVVPERLASLASLSSGASRPRGDRNQPRRRGLSPLWTGAAKRAIPGVTEGVVPGASSCGSACELERVGLQTWQDQSVDSRPILTCARMVEQARTMYNNVNSPAETSETSKRCIKSLC